MWSRLFVSPQWVNKEQEAQTDEEKLSQTSQITSAENKENMTEKEKDTK